MFLMVEGIDFIARIFTCIIDDLNKGSADGRLGFWGGFLGALISTVTAFGVWWLQRENDRKQAVKPILNVCQINGMRRIKDYDYVVDYCNSPEEDQLKNWCLHDEKNAKTWEKLSDKSQWLITEMLIENIGNGPAMQMSIDVEGEKQIKCERNSRICLAQSQSAKYTLYIRISSLKETEFGNTMIFKYSDCYEHEYVQKVRFGIMLNNIDKHGRKEYGLTDLLPISNVKEVKKI